MRIDVQLSPAVESWPRLRDGVRLAEEVGFDTAWTFDHLAGEMLTGRTMLECFTLLGALGAATERIGIGSLVANVANRHPFVLAASAASVQNMSRGRFTLGLGAGASPTSKWAAEHRVAGIELGRTVADRHARFAETLDVLDRVWSPHRAEELATFPLPVPRPRVIVGVNSAALAAIAAARCDGINIRGHHEDLDACIAAAASPHDRARGFEISVWSFFERALLDPDDPRRRRWARLGVSRLVLVWLTPYDAADLRWAESALRESSSDG